MVLLGLLPHLLPQRRPLHRRPLQLRLQGRAGRPLGRLLAHPRHPLRHLPGHVLGHHRCPRHRSCRRARQGPPLRHLHVHLGHGYLRPHRLLDLEPERMVQPDGRPRLCRRHPRAYRLGNRRPRLLDDAGKAPRTRHPRAQLPPAQRDAHCHWHRLPLGWVVRLQRWFRTVSQH